MTETYFDVTIVFLDGSELLESYEAASIEEAMGKALLEYPGAIDWLPGDQRSSEDEAGADEEA